MINEAKTWDEISEPASELVHSSRENPVSPLRQQDSPDIPVFAPSTPCTPRVLHRCAATGFYFVTHKITVRYLGAVALTVLCGTVLNYVGQSLSVECVEWAWVSLSGLPDNLLPCGVGVSFTFSSARHLPVEWVWVSLSVLPDTYLWSGCEFHFQFCLITYLPVEWVWVSLSVLPDGLVRLDGARGWVTVVNVAWYSPAICLAEAKITHYSQVENRHEHGPNNITLYNIYHHNRCIMYRNRTHMGFFL